MLWEKREQVNNCIDLFSRYVEKLLKAKKRVIFGNHMGPLKLSDFFMELYNKCAKQYPGKIYFLWGYEGLNLLTDKVITVEDLRIDDKNNPTTSLWIK